MKLTEAQKKQVAIQLERHNRSTTTCKIVLDKNPDLDLIIERGVFASDIMSSGVLLAQYLYENKDLYLGKTCLDVGCGAGTQGLVMAIYGAKYVDFSDINPNAIKNTQENIRRHNLSKICKTYKSNLFENIQGKYDIIVFNHPFFPEEAKNFGKSIFKDEMLRKSMLGGTNTLKQFLKELRTHFADEDSIYITPYFHFAGKENDPATHVDKYGLVIVKEKRIKSDKGLQLGDFSLYQIKQKSDEK